MMSTLDFIFTHEKKLWMLIFRKSLLQIFFNRKSVQSLLCFEEDLFLGKNGWFFFFLFFALPLIQPRFLQNFYRYLFWSAGHSGRFAIFRSSLSGSDQTLLVHSLLLVSDITISDVEKRVYWLDIGRETLETCTYDGTDRRVLKRSDSLLMLMSGLTLHKVYMQNGTIQLNMLHQMP